MWVSPIFGDLHINKFDLTDIPNRKTCKSSSTTNFSPQLIWIQFEIQKILNQIWIWLENIWFECQPYVVLKWLADVVAWY